MKRRELKKTITYLSGELIAECVAIAQMNSNVHMADVENIILGVARLHDDWVRRLSHVEPGSTRLFFRKLKEEMQHRTDEILEQIQNLG